MKNQLFRFNIGPYVTVMLFWILVIWKQSSRGLISPPIYGYLLYFYMLLVYILCGIMISSMLNIPKEQLESKPFLISAALQLAIIILAEVVYMRRLVFLAQSMYWNNCMYVLLIFTGVYLYQLLKGMKKLFK